MNDHEWIRVMGGGKGSGGSGIIAHDFDPACSCTTCCEWWKTLCSLQDIHHDLNAGCTCDDCNQAAHIRRQYT